MNQLLIAAGGILIAIGVLTPKKKADSVALTEATTVPTPNEIENDTENDSIIPSSVDSV